MQIVFNNPIVWYSNGVEGLSYDIKIHCISDNSGYFITGLGGGPNGVICRYSDLY